jgi:hypothetical protein
MMMPTGYWRPPSKRAKLGVEISPVVQAGQGVLMHGLAQLGLKALIGGDILKAP